MMRVGLSWKDLAQGFVRRQTALVRQGLDAAAEVAAAGIEDDLPWARLEVAGDADEVSVVVVEGGRVVAQAVESQADEIIDAASRSDFLF